MITRISHKISAFCSAALRPRFATSLLRSQRGGSRLDAGFTLLEMVFAVEVMLLLSLISFNEMSRVRHHAYVAACMRYQAIIQRTLWAGYALDGTFPATIVATLNSLPRGAQDKLYSYTPAAGLDAYYMRCGHNHSYVGVLFCDSGAYLTPRPIYALAAARGTL